MIGAYLVDPARRTYVIEELAADAGIAVRSGDAPEPASDDAQLSLGEEPEEPGDPAVEARLAWELAERQRAQLAEFGLERIMREVELPLVEVLVAMEREGLKLDTERLAAIGEGMEARIDELEAEIYEAAGREFTIGSPSQLGEVLFVELGLTRKRRGKTGYSTDARVLSQIRDENPIVPAVEQWRELTKLKNTYLDSLPGLIDPETGRIHTTFNQVTAATGRLSSTNPNLQNIPIRSEVGPPGAGLLRRGRGQPPALAATTTRSSCASSRMWRTRTSCARSSRRARTSTRRRPRASSAPTPTPSRRPSARRRRWSTTASPTA